MSKKRSSMFCRYCGTRIKTDELEEHEQRCSEEDDEKENNQEFSGSNNENATNDDYNSSKSGEDVTKENKPSRSHSRDAPNDDDSSKSGENVTTEKMPSGSNSKNASDDDDGSNEGGAVVTKTVTKDKKTGEIVMRKTVTSPDGSKDSQEVTEYIGKSPEELEDLEHDLLKAPEDESVSTREEEVLVDDENVKEIRKTVDFDDKTLEEAKDLEDEKEKDSPKPTTTKKFEMDERETAKTQEIVEDRKSENEVHKVEEYNEEDEDGGKKFRQVKTITKTSDGSDLDPDEDFFASTKEIIDDFLEDLKESDSEAELAFKMHQDSLVPCTYCENKYKPDELPIHERSCHERSQTKAKESSSRK